MLNDDAQIVLLTQEINHEAGHAHTGYLSAPPNTRVHPLAIGARKPQNTTLKTEALAIGILDANEDGGGSRVRLRTRTSPIAVRVGQFLKLLGAIIRCHNLRPHLL